VQRAHELVVADEHLVEKHLVELGVAGELHEWRTRAGDCMSTTRYEMPLCFGTSASVRARQIPQRANCAYDVQTFCPERSQPSSTRTARVEATRVGTRVGLAEELAPDLVGREDRGQPALLLLVGACASKVGPRG